MIVQEANCPEDRGRVIDVLHGDDVVVGNRRAAFDHANDVLIESSLEVLISAVASSSSSNYVG